LLLRRRCCRPCGSLRGSGTSNAIHEVAMLTQTNKPKLLWALSRADCAAVPHSIRLAILAAAREEGDYAAACRLFVGDVSETTSGEAPGARLEHAVARTMLDAWVHGAATVSDVGVAYADLAFKLREPNGHD
jgi:hypothetical protein